jgi:hypothetical protein
VPIPVSLLTVLHAPTPAALWALRGDLLAAGMAPDHRALPVLASFHGFLDRLATGSSSRSYSDLASRMDISALGGVIAQELSEAGDATAMARRLMSGVLSEGLAVLATRQHVKAWGGELEAVYRQAAWDLYGMLWSFACRRRPELAAEKRRALLDELLAPVLDAGVAGGEKAIVAGRLFQLLLVDALADDPVG